MTVQPGDTLRGIAGRFGVSFEEVARANGVVDADRIYPGQVLRVVPCGKGGRFGASARGVRLTEGGRRLEAELLGGDGRWCGSGVELDERIGNDDGVLRFVG